MPLFFGGNGVLPDLKGQTTNVVTLQAGAVYSVPNDWFEVVLGKYTVLQEIDPISGAWRGVGSSQAGATIQRLKGDGNNYRLANQTGCVVGALLTTAGSGYTTAPTVTATSGGSIWRAIVGGAVGASGSGTAPTVTNGGTNYTYPPQILFSAPPAGGIQATGYCTLTGPSVTSVTVTDQGAGYTQAPTITFQNDPREGQNNVPLGSGAAAIATLTGAGTITGLICLDHGTPTSIPTLNFSSGAAVATPIMCWSMTAYTVSSTTTGSGYAAPVIVSAYGGFPSTTPSYTNPTTQSNLVKVRKAFIVGNVSGSAMTATGQVVEDGGIYSGTPTVFTYGGFPQGAGASAAVLSPTMGGLTDTSYVLTT
jgi:hypothetical protein